MPRQPKISEDAGNPLLSNPMILAALTEDSPEDTPSNQSPESYVPSTATPGNTRDAVLALLLEELMSKKQEKIAVEEQQKRARLINLEGTRRVLAETEAARRACPHTKPSGASALAGQRDHQGVEHMICQYCQQSYKGTEIPSHLRVDPVYVGGPHR